MAQDVKQFVFEKRPALKQIIENNGSLSLYEYASRFYHGTDSDNALFKKRKSEFLDILHNFTEKKFGSAIARETVESLQKNYCVSTADHHGPLGHPFFFQS
jgi:hypothetical protein